MGSLTIREGLLATWLGELLVFALEWSDTVLESADATLLWASPLSLGKLALALSVDGPPAAP
jgi:hypothetical protein